MYVDEYRLRKGAKDNVRECNLDCLPYKHRISNRECKHNAAYIADRNAKPRSKHSPISQDNWVPF